MLNPNENCQKLYIIYALSCENILIMENCAKWLIWMLRNSSYKFINLISSFGFSERLLNLNNDYVR
jgi:hypothetical protein